MNKMLLFFLVAIAMSSFCVAQGVYDGISLDSTIIRFNLGSSPLIVPDTSSSPLWQMGLTHKAFFTTDTFGTKAIMTDTINYYPRNANNWFVLKVPRYTNAIIDFWHRYQTNSIHAGGVVEFSLDHGTTWQNIKGTCNSDSIGGQPGVRTTNCYSFADTLFNNTPAFIGTSGVSSFSRVQFFTGFPHKTTNSGCSFSVDSIYVRFRFVSDSTIDSLAGWMIDSIKIENDNFGSGGIIRTDIITALRVFPNPSHDGSFTFPALNDEQDFTITIYNVMGGKAFTAPYRHALKLDSYPNGLYFYKATNGLDYYSGQLLKE